VVVSTAEQMTIPSADSREPRRLEGGGTSAVGGSGRAATGCSEVSVVRALLRIGGLRESDLTRSGDRFRWAPLPRLAVADKGEPGVDALDGVEGGEHLQ